MSAESGQELVSLTIDDQKVEVPRGTNIIEAARSAGIEIPFYCYHPHLSVPGNCRICQVEVEKAPKLMIGCHTQVQPDMVVRTHNTSEKVKSAQESTMEMLLINHPLDCTVCDQAGHCKLQDYHYEYNAKPSRFLEVKENKVKAEPLGPTVMLDGERCIACTRCVRFCDEVTETGEIGLLNRGDQYVIAVKEGHELNNPFSGTVVDLCPVGALTHREWRFNTRIWYANKTDSVCPGCSTGCNVKVYERDGEVVQVKARLNSEVNKEWLCDEGRYGFDRFLSKNRANAARVGQEQVSLDTAVKELGARVNSETIVLVSPDLLLEDFALLAKLKEDKWKDVTICLAHRSREVSKLESILVSPDYAANIKGAEFFGIESSESVYDMTVNKIRTGGAKGLVMLGDLALTWKDQENADLREAISKLDFVAGAFAASDHSFAELCQLTLPVRSVLERSGMMLNKDERLQYLNKAVEFQQGSHPVWRVLKQLLGSGVEASDDRSMTRWLLANEERFDGLKIAQIKGLGVPLASKPTEAAA